MKYIEDCLLTWITKRCKHPNEMVAFDILEGSADDVAVRYCRRCGAVKVVIGDETNHANWRLPMPHLWRG